MRKVLLLVLFGLVVAVFSAQPAVAQTTETTQPLSPDQKPSVCCDTQLQPKATYKYSDVVRAWGYNYHGQLGDGTNTDRTTPVRVSNLGDVRAIAGGGYHSLALKVDGTVRAWGDNFFGELGDGTNTDRNKPVQVINLSGVRAIAAGSNHSLAAAQ